MTNTIELFATLKEINYSVKITSKLPTHSLSDLTNNALVSKPNCILKTDKDSYAFSQWVSPKRTRSFPYARVYDTLRTKNRITLIPFCKDEGFDGDRDFIQWDTVSLMSLLNVHVIVGYYIAAQKNNRPKQMYKHKITGQLYDYLYVTQQINEIENYQSSALHWNLSQMEKLYNTAKLTFNHYQNIALETGVKLHSEKGIRNRIKTIKNSIDEFKNLSRLLAKKAQWRESLTTQPKERVIGKKISISMKNLLGGYYFMTADEGMLINNKFYLVEKKHSVGEILPSYNDIKDSLIKMALFTNINKLTLNGQVLPHRPVVGLTSPKIVGYLHSKMSDRDITKFIITNNLNLKEKQKLLSVVLEARSNKFGLFIINSNKMQNQEEILSRF